MSFWQHLPKPFFTLAPMADVTDPAYRKLIAETGKPDATWTEFVSADGLFHTRAKKVMEDNDNPLLRDLNYTEGERPVVAQFFTGSPEMMEAAAALAVERGFDGIDINMGCPVGNIVKQGAGSDLIKDPENAKELIRAAKRGAGGRLPVSVKTRIGYNKIEYKDWLPYLLAEDIVALTLHMRTRKEMSLVPAHWELGSEIVEFCRKENPNVLLQGNGDLKSIADARAKAEEYGFDGMMLGRAIFGNPWLFTGKSPTDFSPQERIEMLIKLAGYFEELHPRKHFAILKKHFKAFISGWDGAAELRAKLMETNTLEELTAVLHSYK